MNILFVSMEVAPFAKVGGLADVAGALPKALRRLGHDARVIMPCHRMIEDDQRWRLESKLEPFWVPMGYRGNKYAFYKETEHDGLPVGFIGTDDWFSHAVNNQSIYQPGDMQYLFFSRAVMMVMEKLDWIPDIVHCNDWHTGFLPVLIREQGGRKWKDVATVYTIHNLEHQGKFDISALDVMGLSRWLFNSEQVEAYGCVNFLKAGCVFSDRVTTVSRTYAREIQSWENSWYLEGLMSHLGHHGRLSGILNGLDTELYDPATDPGITAHFTFEDLAGKRECRRQLFERLNMAPIPGAPLLGSVGRLFKQKGPDLILEAAEAMFSLPVQLVLQGVGDYHLAEGFKALERRFPNHFRYISQFDDPISPLIYAGSDGFLMPSRYEPCGLSQMIAMRYGTVPVVRSTGGLADTVSEGFNGFTFRNVSALELLAAVARARELYQHPDRWQELVLNGMKGDYTWGKSAAEYVQLYEAAHRERTSSMSASD